MPAVTKITVTGLADGTWKLSEPNLIRKSVPYINITNLQSFYAGSSSYGYPIIGHPAADGYYFIGSVKPEGVSDPTFTLTNGTDTYTKTFTGKTLKKKSAIKIAGPTASNFNGWAKLDPI